MTKNFETIKMYNWEVEVKFYPKSHIYKIWKKRLPSVTTVTGVINKPFLLQWAVNCMRDYLLGLGSITTQDIIDWSNQHRIKKDDAADVGTQIHNWIENDIVWEFQDMPEDDRVVKWVLAYLDWKKDQKILESERLVYSKQYQYVWRFDLLAEIDWKIVLIDFKTSNNVYPEYYIQMAGYVIALEEETGIKVDNTMILHIDKIEWVCKEYVRNGGEIEQDKKAFIASLLLKQYLNANSKS